MTKFSGTGLITYILILLLTQQGWGQGFTSKDKFDWGIRAYDERACQGSGAVIADTKLFLERRGNELFLFSPDPRPLMRFLSDDKDAIAVEKVYLSSYKEDTSELGRNNGSSIFNGKVLAPVYRKELYDQIAQGFRWGADERRLMDNGGKVPTYWRTRIGVDDSEDNEPFEYNLLFLKNSSLCKIRYYRNPAGQEHDFYEGIKILSEWPDKELRIIPILKTFAFQVPFERNEVNIVNEQESLYGDVWDDFIVRGVKIWAYASIEGNRELNEQLQMQRARNIEQSLKKYMPSDVPFRIIARENWERFAEQVEGTELDTLQNMTRTEIKDLLKSEDNLSTFGHLLYDQRKAVVKVFYNTKPQDYDTVHIIQHNFRQALDSIASRKKRGKTYSYYVRDAEGLYNWLFIELQKNKITEEEFMQWTFPLDPTYHKMINNQFWYQYYHEGTQTAMMENYIKLVGLDREASDIERFNLISYILEKEYEGTNNSGLFLEDLGRLMRSRAYYHIPREDVLRIAIPLFTRLASYYHQDFNNWDRRNLMLNDLMTLFEQDSAKSEDEWLRLAEFSAHLGNSFVANEIIDRFKESGSSTFDYLDLTLNYDHPEVDSETFDSEAYYGELMSFYEQQGEENWCQLFENGEISFQALDHPDVFRLHLEKCQSPDNP